MSRGATLVGVDVPDRRRREGRRRVRLRRRRRLRVANATSTSAARPAATPTASASGKFTLDGKEYQLFTNDGPNHLHGGNGRSLDKVIWAGEPFERDGERGVKFTYTSPDGEEGYPGKLKMRRHLHADRQERNAHRVRGDDRQADGASI